MPNLTIHELYAAMSGNVTSQDYRNKDRDAWSAWDWICALKDGLTGDAPGARYDFIAQMKEELQAIQDARRELPGMTEEQMLARYGRRLRVLTDAIYQELNDIDEPKLTEDELDLMQAFSDELELDDEDDVREAERNVRFARFREASADYIAELIEQRLAEEAQQNPNQERLMDLTAKIYVANDLRSKLEERAGGNWPEVFSPAETDRLAQKMLAEDNDFRSAVMTDVIQHPLSDVGLQPAVPEQLLAQEPVENYLNRMARDIKDLAPNNYMLLDAGDNVVTGSNAPVRLALLKDVKKELDATGTGWSWNHWFGRPNNSGEYEAVRAEINRQIARMEAGLPVGDTDRARMMQVLDAYTAGKEDPNTAYGKTRQQNMLRLYSAYATDEEAAAVMNRYNRARGTQDPGHADHIDLNAAPYRFNHVNQPQSAASQYSQALLRLTSQYNDALAAGRPLTEAEQVTLRQNVLRLAALRDIMAKNRTGEATEVSEADILAAENRIEQDPRDPVAGAVAAAGRDLRTFGELVHLYDEALLNNYQLQEKYFSDPAHYADPLSRSLKQLSYPTADQLYRHAASQLAAIRLPQQGGLSQRQIDEFARLSRQVFALKRIIDRRNPQYHVSSAEQLENVRYINENTRIGAALSRLNMDAVRMERFRSQLLSPTVSSSALADSAERYANGYIEETVSEAQDFFRRIQVPKNDPPLSDADKDAVRNQFVRLAALHNLENKRVRDARFPERLFQSERSFSDEDIEAAMEDVRQNEPDFLAAIEPHLTSAQSVKDLAGRLATIRYRDLVNQNDADLAAMEQLSAERFELVERQIERQQAGGDNQAELAALDQQIAEKNAQIRAMADQFPGRVAALLALRNLQEQKGSLAAPVTEEELQAEIENVKLSDQYLAAERYIANRTSIRDLEKIQAELKNPETLNAYLTELISTAAAPEPANGTLGAEYSTMHAAMTSTADPGSQPGRSMIAMNMLRTLAIRQLVLEAEDGQYAPSEANAVAQRMSQLAVSPAYRQLVQRVTEDRQTAINVLQAFMNEGNLYELKIEQRRAQARGEQFADPLVQTIRQLTDLRYQQIFDMGMKQFSDLQAEAKPGVPLTEEQKGRLVQAVAQMILSREGEGNVQLPEEQRLARLRELTDGNSEFSRGLLAAADRLALDGSKLNDILPVVAGSREQMSADMRAFSSQTPEKWANDAWESLSAMAEAPHPNGWTREEREPLVQAYARMMVMRQAAKDPAQANVPVPLTELNQRAAAYLAEGANRAVIENALQKPQDFLIAGTVGKKLEIASLMQPIAGIDPTESAAAKLQRMMALQSLKEQYAPEAAVTEEQIRAAENAFKNTLAYRVLSHPLNAQEPVYNWEALAGPNYKIELERELYNSPARKAVLLGDIPENSFEGRRILYADELRHDQELGAGEAAERLHIAELYALSLYNDGTLKAEDLPSPSVITDQARIIMELPDFKAAMRLINDVPQYKASLINALTSGAPASQITAELNRRSEARRRLDNVLDVRKSDLHYDVRSAMVQQTLQKLRGLDAKDKWLTEDEARQAAASLNVRNPGMTKEQARSTYLDFLASNRLYMRNPGRAFFSEAEMAAARQEVEQDPEVQSDLETVLQSPKEMRFNIFNLAPSQYWTEIRAMEEGRDVFLNAPGGDGTKMLGLQTILFSLAPIVEARLNGRDVTGRVISNDDLNIERNRVAYTEEFISLENALRRNINELDRIKDVLKLPADQFKAAFDALTAEYKEKYPEAPIPDRNTLGGDYLRAKEQIAAVQGKDFANDPEARKQLAGAIREIMTIRNIILTSKYDVALKKNTVSESDARDTRGCEAAEEAGKHHITMRLGTPEYLEEKLKDPQVAAKYIQIMGGAEDLRRLYGKKLAAGREIVDPLEQQLLDQGLDAPVPSHKERQLAAINEISTPVWGETGAQRTARLKQQVASLFNLVLHAAGTDPKNMPSDAVLAEQTKKILAVPDFGYAVERLAKDPQKMTDFINKAIGGMNARQMADELNKLSYDEQKERNPEAYPIVDIVFRMRVNAMNEANDGLMHITSSGSPKWNSNAHRDEALVSFMTYTAANRLMAQHPDHMYFSEKDFQDSFLQAMNDQQLQQEFVQSMTGGPVGVRADLFSYGGGALLTAFKFINSNVAQLNVLDNDKDTREAFREVTLKQLGVIAWLHENHLVEENHFTTTKQTDDAQDAFALTPEYKTLFAASKLDNGEMNRFMAQLLPLSGDAFKQALANVTAEYRKPLDLNYRKDLNRITIGLHADKLLNPGPLDKTDYVRENVIPFLADTVNLALLGAVPEAERPNAEEFIRMREELMKVPEFEKAALWLSEHYEELKQLSVDLGKGLTPEQIVARFNEAAVKQMKEEDPKAQPSVNLTFQLQLQMMTAQRSKYWSRCAAKQEWAAGDKEQFKEEFLDFCAMDALIKANPKRVWFGKEEIKAARRPFEADQDFMAKVEGALESPIVARNKICAFRADNTWNWIRQATVQMNNVLPMLANPKTSDQIKQQLISSVSAALAQVAVTKIRSQTYYEPSTKQMMTMTEDMNASIAFRAIARALMKDPALLPKLQNEVYSLEGEAFRTKLDEVGRYYYKKYPQAKADSIAMKAAYEKDRAALAKNNAPVHAQPVQPPKQEAKPEIKQPVQPKPEVKPEVKQPVQPKPEVKPEVKQPVENPNRINIINEPENLNVIHEEKLPPAVAAKLKPVTLVMPKKQEKQTAFGQYQISAAQLDKTLALQEASKIPINDPNFVDAAYHGVLQTAAYRNLAEKKEYFTQKISREALNAEVARLKNDKQLQPLKEAIRNGYGKTILDGIKHLEDQPKRLDGFLRNMAADPAGTKKRLEQEFQRPAAKYLPVPSLPKTEVVNDAIPKAAEGQKFDINSPAGRYQNELKAYENAMQIVKETGMKGLGAGYNDTIHKSLLTLYSLNQIMAGTKDPTAPVEDLDAQIYQNYEKLNNAPGSFRHIVEGSKQDMRFRDHVIGIFKNNGSFTQLNEKLQSNAEKVLRYDTRMQNEAIERDNNRLIREAEKQKNKGLDQPQY